MDSPKSPSNNNDDHLITNPPEVPWPPETGIWAAYNFHCHCGAIRWSSTLSPPLFARDVPETSSSASTTAEEQLYPVISCTCSYCARNGYLTIHPLASNVTFTQGLQFRGEYLTANKLCPHWFCTKCGSAIGTNIGPQLKKMSPGEEPRVALNVRMLKGNVDLRELKVKELGFMRDMPPVYDVDRVDDDHQGSS